MAADLPGLAIAAGLLLPALAAAAWAMALERRPRRPPAAPDAEPEPDFTVAGIQARVRQEQALRRLAEEGTVALPTLPIPAQTRREPDPLPSRVAGTVPPSRPAARVPASRFAFAPPDTDLMQRILDGLRKLD
ncbi:hypothetical protein ABJI51_38360 [Amycolatopsis sp. NEAU-NG30]|uniref:Uncharacterized protein n=1 Tax=Amycolatopsis melonis TaxID=3156488 RepID=A0ABV0LRP1_9PSEU